MSPDKDFLKKISEKRKETDKNLQDQLKMEKTSNRKDSRNKFLQNSVKFSTQFLDNLRESSLNITKPAK